MSTRPAAGRRMLVVDADAPAGCALRDCLRDDHADDAWHVVSLDEAHARLDADAWDVVWIDAGGQPGAALDFVRAALRRRVPPACVVTSAYTTLDDALAALRAGACDYVTKPYVDAELRLVRTRALQAAALQREAAMARVGASEHDAPRTSLAIIGSDPRMQRVLEVAHAVAKSRTSVLMTGESGTGKSMIARAIHDASPRRDKPFVEVSCGSISEALLESELFGHVRGAFTGAHADKVGRFQAAHTGTLFLDEINSASPAMQLKLLRVLEERRFEPVGSSRSQDVDVRVIVATNEPLEPLVARGAFRQDLFFRLHVVAIELPALRDRRDDIPALCEHFLSTLSAEAGRAIVGFSPDALEALRAYDYPGNIRELRNIIERAVVLARGQVLTLDDLPEGVRHAPLASDRAHIAASHDFPASDESSLTLDVATRAFERRVLLAALEACQGNRSKAARRLGIDRTTLYKKLHAHGLARRDDTPGTSHAA